MATFSQRLVTAILSKSNPVVVGLDPRWQSIPQKLRGTVQYGDWPAMAKVYEQFCCEVIDSVFQLVPLVKPQAAFFEELGPYGLVALDRVMRYATQKGLLVILDGKRNDIGSTATAMPKLICNRTTKVRGKPMRLTVSPYLGEDSLLPFLDVAQNEQTGIFVLVKTSNPGGGMFQDRVSQGQTIYQIVANWVEINRANEPMALATAIVGLLWEQPIPNNWPNYEQRCHTRGS